MKRSLVKVEDTINIFVIMQNPEIALFNEMKSTLPRIKILLYFQVVYSQVYSICVPFSRYQT